MSSDSEFPDVHESGVPYGSLHSSKCKEQFSIAFVHAIVTTARCKLENIEVDDESVDATIKQVAPHSELHHVTLDVQLKCTAQDIVRGDGSLAWPLSQKNYTELSTRRRGPVILVVLRVPRNFEQWTLHDTGSLSLVHGAHWVNLRGAAESPEGSGKTVRIPRENHFTAEQLLGMMERIGNGGFP